MNEEMSLGGCRDFRLYELIMMIDRPEYLYSSRIYIYLHLELHMETYLEFDVSTVLS